MVYLSIVYSLGFYPSVIVVTEGTSMSMRTPESSEKSLYTDSMKQAS